MSATAIVNSYITDNKVNGIALVSCSYIKQLEEILYWSDYRIKQNMIEELDLL